MTISLFEASVPHFVRMLNNLWSILDKARLFAEINHIDETALINNRLAPDMYPLGDQLRIVADMAKACTARLAGIPIPKDEDNEIVFADYQARIARTIAILEGINAEKINSRFNQKISIRLQEREIVYDSKTYLLDVIIPHFYFHVTTVYAILRHQGVELGKKDYLDNE